MLSEIERRLDALSLLRAPPGAALTYLPDALLDDLHKPVHCKSVVNARAIERRDGGKVSVHLRGLTQPLPVGRAHRGRCLNASQQVPATGRLG